MAPLVVLDYNDLISGTEEQRQRFITQFVGGLTDFGFVKILNHPFNAQHLKEVFQWGYQFFDQPVEVKEEIKNFSNPVRGYTGYAVENTNDLYGGSKKKALKDAKEHFDQGPTHDAEYPNQWPKHLPGFEQSMTSFYEQCERVSLELVGAVEWGLGIRDGSMIKRCIPGGADLRLAHYPEIAVEEMESGRSIRIAPHLDFGIMSLLFQDSVGGLEAEDRAQPGGEGWIPLLSSSSTEMLVNVGETMQRWTNDRLKGGLHRVTTPAGMKDDIDASIPRRLSVAFLFKAKRDASVGPLPAFVTEKEPSKYAEMNGLQYHQVRLGSLYT